MVYLTIPCRHAASMQTMRIPAGMPLHKFCQQFILEKPCCNFKQVSCRSIEVTFLLFCMTVLYSIYQNFNMAINWLLISLFIVNGSNFFYVTYRSEEYKLLTFNFEGATNDVPSTRVRACYYPTVDFSNCIHNFKERRSTSWRVLGRFKNLTFSFLLQNIKFNTTWHKSTIGLTL